MSNVWFTSDLHIGHDTVARERTRGMVLPRYVGAEVDAHDRILARNWDDAVRPDDQVWVLGDLCIGGTEATACALNWISNRPGTKHLIAGNHDPVHPMHRDAHRWQSAFMQVFASVQPFARRRINGEPVLLSHFPYSGDHTAEDRCDQYRLRMCGVPLLHGHTHSRQQTSVAYEAHTGLPARQIHVGVDAWRLAPVPLATVAELLADMEGAP